MKNPESRFDTVSITVETDHSPKLQCLTQSDYVLVNFLTNVSDITENNPIETKELKFVRIHTIFVELTMASCFY